MISLCGRKIGIEEILTIANEIANSGKEIKKYVDTDTVEQDRNTMNKRISPDHWETVQLKEIVNLRRENMQPEARSGRLNFVGLKHIDSGVSYLERWGDASEVRSVKARFYPNDVLYGRLNAHLDKAVIAEIEGICSTDILVLIANSKVIPRFLVYFLHSRSFRRYAVSTSSGITLPRTSWNALGKFTFSLPPLAEQRRIVAKLEVLFTHLDAAVACLKNVQVQLQQYRRSILKAAFEGALTKEWREEYTNKLQSTDNSTVFPSSWEKTTVRKVIRKVSLSGKKLKKSDYELKGKLPAIDQGLSFIGGYTNDESLKVKCELPVIVFGDHTRTIKYIDFDFVGGADGIKVIKPHEIYHPKLFYYFIRAISLPDRGYSRHFQFLEKAQIPVPSLAEQECIVSEVERCLSAADEVEASVTAELTRAERLRRSILQSAFSGELVAQDSTDEPAERLLLKS